MLRKFMITMVAAGVLASIGAGPASAAPPGPAPAPGQDMFVELTQVDRSSAPSRAAAPRQSAAAADDDATSLRMRRQDYLERAAEGSPQARALAPAESVDVTECAAELFSYRTGGFVIDHYNYCHSVDLRATVKICETRIPLLGCINSRTVGSVTWTMTTKGSGWDGDITSPANPFPQYSQIYFVTMLHNFKPSNAAILALNIKPEMLCEAQAPAVCRAQPTERETSRTVAEWMADSGTFFRQLADPTQGTGRDRLTWFDFDLKSTISYPGADGDDDTFDGSSFRCDEAYYLKGERGCMFDDVESLHAVSLDSTTNYRKAALHIYDAFYQPDRTQPQKAGKDVAGNLESANPRPLTRAFEDYDPKTISDNRGQAISTCRDYWGPDYAQGGQFDCDEYPFASTYQGSALDNGNYSARVIDASDNRSAGSNLGKWYESARILHEDPFFVVLTTSGGGGGGGGGEELPNRAPTVSAGPDVSAYEGAPATLRGAVRDLEGGTTVRWSYQVQSGKSAMTCRFADANRPATRITCNDEGTVRVTLTADDGTNTPVSDSATVTVLNAAPELELTGPKPWTVFKARTPVSLTAPFTDAGELDTHTCSVTWDDAKTDNYPAQSSTCDRQHTFAHAGMYTIKVSVTDDGGLSDSATTMIVVYDPDAAFDNADGSIASPAGAWNPQPTKTGQLDFHLTANYYGRDLPTGTAKAYLANTDLRLDSGTTGLQWLVVTPDGKVAAKGTATVNGRSGYGFVYYAYDGCTTGSTVQCTPGPDKFRMVIWPLSSGANPGAETWYDNRPAAGYDVDVSDPQQIATGAVTIHPPAVAD